MNDKELRKHLLLAFEYSYLHDAWVNPLGEALDGLSAEDALRRPAPEHRCIWEIVLHLAVWAENIVARVETGEPARPQEGAWPPLPDPADEAAWQSAQRRLWGAEASVRAMLESASFDQIAASPYGLADIICRFVHNGYHLGQITKLRELSFPQNS